MTAFRKSLVLAAALGGLAAGSAQAQEALVAKVPFPFVVQGAQLPAGTYDILDNQGLLTIVGKDQRGTAVTLSRPASGHDPRGGDPSLVFTHLDGEYVLSQVWESGNDGLSLERPSVARRRHSEAESNGQTSSTVVPADYGR